MSLEPDSARKIPSRIHDPVTQITIFFHSIFNPGGNGLCMKHTSLCHLYSSLLAKFRLSGRVEPSIDGPGSLPHLDVEPNFLPLISIQLNPFHPTSALTLPFISGIKSQGCPRQLLRLTYFSHINSVLQLAKYIFYISISTSFFLHPPKVSDKQRVQDVHFSASWNHHCLGRCVHGQSRSSDGQCRSYWRPGWSGCHL